MNLGFRLPQNHFVCVIKRYVIDHVTRKYYKNEAHNGSVWLLKHLVQFQALKKVLCSDNYSFLRLRVRKLFKGGNYLREETIYY